MNCRKCGAEYEGNFCPNCGTKKELVCAKCGAEYEGDFCTNCGTKAIKQGKLLGFRTNKTWKKVLSIIYIVMIGFYILGSFTSINSINDAVNSVQGLLFMIAPYIFLSNFKLRNILPLFKKHKKGLSFLGMLCVYFAIAILCTIINPATYCEHEWIETEKVGATCTKDGRIDSHCDLCDSDNTEYIDKKGHSFEVTEDTDEKTVKVCSVCGEETVEKKNADKETEKPNNNDSKPTDNNNKEENKENKDNFFNTDKDQKDTDSIKKDFGIETTDKLRELGFTVEEATSIYNIFVKIGVNQISDVQKGAGTGIDNLQSFVAIANNDKQLKFYFTVENRQLYYAGFRDAALYDSTEGGVLKNIGDVHIPKTDVDANTYSQLQVMSQNIVKQYLNYPNTAKFPWLDGWGVGRSDDNYRISGKVTAKNGFGVESEMTFSVYFLKTNDTFTVEAVVIDGQRVK